MICLNCGHLLEMHPPVIGMCCHPGKNLWNNLKGGYTFDLCYCTEFLPSREDEFEYTILSERIRNKTHPTLAAAPTNVF